MDDSEAQRICRISTGMLLLLRVGGVRESGANEEETAVLKRPVLVSEIGSDRLSRLSPLARQDPA
jgi:hypothetical protein